MTNAGDFVFPGGDDTALISRQPDSPNSEHALSGEVATVGRGADNEVVLESNIVSRHHARIERSPTGFTLHDLGSKNGTWVNGDRVSGSIALRDGDVVRFGDLEFSFRSRRAAFDATVTSFRVSGPPRETVTVMFTDLEGHTQMFERLGSEAVYELLAAHFRALKQEVQRHSGRVIEVQGDGLIASFSSIRSAVDCAIAIQRGADGAWVKHDDPARVRIGINSGEALSRGEDLVGMAVIKASRIMSIAGGGEIFLSEVSRTLLGPATGLRLTSKGWHELKGLPRKERVFAVEWRAR